MNSQRACQFLVVLLLIFPSEMFSQQQIPRIEQKNPHRTGMSKDFASFSPMWQKLNTMNAWYSGDQQPLIKMPIGGTTWIKDYRPPFQLATNFVSTLPFFCKSERQFEKNTSIPLRFRLGSLEYVNRLERKN